MRKIRLLILTLSLLAFAGCSSGVTRPDDKSTAMPEIRALQGFTIELSAEAEVQLADNVKFDIETLRATLARTLESRNLIAPDGSYRLRVVVNDIRVRSTFNAVVWGFMAGNDHLRGNATVQNLADEPVYEFGASASYALGGFGGGQDSSRINWLYEKFSEMIADELQGKRDE